MTVKAKKILHQISFTNNTKNKYKGRLPISNNQSPNSLHLRTNVSRRSNKIRESLRPRHRTERARQTGQRGLKS